MKYFALTTNKPCKHCGKFHGYITHAHSIIIANEQSKFIMDTFCKRHPESKVTEVDLGFQRKHGISTIDILEVFKKPVPSESTNGSSG